MVLLIISQTACNGKAETEPVSGENYYLDTICVITIYDMEGGLSEEGANAVIEKAWDRCRALDKLLTNKNDASEVSAINAAGGEWVTVGEDVLNVVKAGVAYSELSGGDFDITIGTVTDLWDFHSDDPEIPAEGRLREALRHVDYRNVEIDGNRVRLLDPEAKLDLGGIAKGYVGDQLAALLETEGVTSAIVNLGGNVVSIGKKPDGSDFVIGIEKPFSDRTELIGSTDVHDATVVTSGVYERQFEVDGTIYHHVLSTKTGYPVDTDLDAVSLVTEKGHSMDADAMSTICLIKGLAEGQRFIEAQDGVEAVFCPSDGPLAITGGMNFTER